MAWGFIGRVAARAATTAAKSKTVQKGIRSVRKWVTKPSARRVSTGVGGKAVAKSYGTTVKTGAQLAKKWGGRAITPLMVGTLGYDAYQAYKGGGGGVPDPSQGDDAVIGVPSPDPEGGGAAGDYTPDELGDVYTEGMPNEFTGRGYEPYYDVLAALGILPSRVSAHRAKKPQAKKPTTKKSKTKKVRKPKGKAEYSFKALAVRWRKLSEGQKRKYEGKFSDYVKVKREGGISAKRNTKKSKVSGKVRHSGSKVGGSKRSTKGLKAQQNKMKAAAKRWKSYKGRMTYREFMTKELRK